MINKKCKKINKKKKQIQLGDQIYLLENKDGIASFHFEEPINLTSEIPQEGLYISYLNAPSTWKLNNQSKLLEKKYFHK